MSSRLNMVYKKLLYIYKDSCIMCYRIYVWRAAVAHVVNASALLVEIGPDTVPAKIGHWEACTEGAPMVQQDLRRRPAI